MSGWAGLGRTICLWLACSVVALVACVEVEAPTAKVTAQCHAGTTACDGKCVDLGTDGKSCGACGEVCAQCLPN